MRKSCLTAAALLTASVLCAENLIPGDTSFETEPDTMVSGRVSPALLRFTWDDREAFHGKCSIRVDWDRKNRLGSFSKTNGSYWLDAFQVDKGDKALPYQPSAPMHCGVRLNVPEGRGDIRSTMWIAYYAGEDKITGTGKEIMTEVGGGVINRKDPRKYLKFVLE